MEIKIVVNKTMLNSAFKIRKTVFVEEQKVLWSEEIDQFEKKATHFLVYVNKKAVATCRMREYDYQTIKIERVCILKSYRKLKIGKHLMTFVENEAFKQGYNIATLNAQIFAIPFYQKLGYKIISPVFIDANIAHQSMEKYLS